MYKKGLFLTLVVSMSAPVLVQPTLSAAQLNASLTPAASQVKSTSGVSQQALPTQTLPAQALPKVVAVPVNKPAQSLQRERRELQLVLKNKGKLAEFRAWLNSGTPAANAVATGLYIGAALPIILLIPVLLSLKKGEGNLSQEQINQVADQLHLRQQLNTVNPDRTRVDGAVPTERTPECVTHDLFAQKIKENADVSKTQAEAINKLTNNVIKLFAQVTSLSGDISQRIIKLRQEMDELHSRSSDGVNDSDVTRIVELERQMKNLAVLIQQSNKTKADNLSVFSQKLGVFEGELATIKGQLQLVQENSSRRAVQPTDK